MHVRAGLLFCGGCTYSVLLFFGRLERTFPGARLVLVTKEDRSSGLRGGTRGAFEVQKDCRIYVLSQPPYTHARQPTRARHCPRQPDPARQFGFGPFSTFGERRVF